MNVMDQLRLISGLLGLDKDHDDVDYEGPPGDVEEAESADLADLERANSQTSSDELGAMRPSSTPP